MSNIHDEIDERHIAIDNVGICDYKLPITFKSKKIYNSVAEISAGVSLKEDIKGAHLSRIIETLDSMVANKEITIRNFDNILSKLSKMLETGNANLKLKFDVIFEKNTPVSNRVTYLNSNIILGGAIDRCVINKSISLTANGAMLCPNSKAKSLYGAHSQKCCLESTFYGNIDCIEIEEAFNIIASQFSAEVYGVVKSSDEKYLTEKAYDNPKFSEDLIRDTLLSLKEYYSGGAIKTKIKNLESIHQHNVYAEGSIK